MEKINIKRNWIRVLSNVFIVIVAIFFDIVSEIAWLNYCDSLCGIFGILKYVICCVAIILGFYSVIKINESLKGLLKIFVLVFLLLMEILMIFVILGRNGVEVSSVNYILGISETENEDFISVKNGSDIIDIKCDKVIKDNLILNENVLYDMEYRYLERGNEKIGVLGSIDICNPIDNR